MEGTGEAITFTVRLIEEPHIPLERSRFASKWECPLLWRLIAFKGINWHESLKGPHAAGYDEGYFPFFSSLLFSSFFSHVASSSLSWLLSIPKHLPLHFHWFILWLNSSLPFSFYTFLFHPHPFLFFLLLLPFFLPFFIFAFSVFLTFCIYNNPRVA